MTPASPLKLYVYAQCDTCRNAVKYLTARGVQFQTIPIREQPPTPVELQRMLEACGGDLKKLFNTSGRDYQQMLLKERLPQLTVDEALELLSTHGNLVKRPFLLGANFGFVGFKETEWNARFK